MNRTGDSRIRRSLVGMLFAGLSLALGQHVGACTTVMVGRGATPDGSVLLASSCDGDVMGLVYAMPAQVYPPGTTRPMYWNVPRPKTYDEYRQNVRDGYDMVGITTKARRARSIEGHHDHR